jgi:YD repeat-containing protein
MKPNRNAYCFVRPGLAALVAVSILTCGLSLRAALPPYVEAAWQFGQVQLRWNSQPGTLYAIQSRASLTTGTWTTVDSVAAQGLQTTWAETIVPTGQRYYQIVAPGGEVSLVEPPERPPAQPCTCGAENHQPAAPPHLHLFSGEFHYEVEDLRIPGRGFDFVWARKYRSRLGPDTGQGNGWDFSYNVSARRVGPHLEVRDGNTRRDVYTLQPDGTYGADGLFAEGTVVGDSLTIRFSDNGRWEFHPFNSSLVRGKLRQSVDRNGNTMRFEYDGLGRLVRVVDTLGRTNTVAYNTDGYISAITDFSGRQVRYEYCQFSDPDGSPGDLKHVISPVVTNTPHGNDFPGGTTNTYAYSKGQPQPALNGNLLTITDAKGQTWLSNRYSAVTTVTNRNFDTIEIEFIGLSLQSLNLVYLAAAADPTNNGAVKRTIVNDRAGKVQEHYFDDANREVLRREFTGRADAALPTTDTVNRPINPLRGSDPAYFETAWQWNPDFLPVQIVYPSGNSISNVHERALNPAAPPRTRGALRERHRLPGLLGGAQPVLVDLYEYDTTYGGCCGFNFVTRHTDPRGSVTLHAYDARGNRTNTTYAVPGVIESWEYNAYGQMTAHVLPDNGSGHRRRDEFTYYPSGPQAGYRHQQIVDTTGAALTTTYEYDAVGNRARVVDPGGHDTRYTYDAADRLVRTETPLVNTSNGPVRYETLRWHDANGNLIRVDVQNMDEQGALQLNTWFTTTYAHDELNRLIGTTREVDATHTVTRTYAYDANGNRTLIANGEAANGNDPFNNKNLLYDERDLVFQVIRASGGTDQSTTQYDYDANGNLSRTSRGLESSPRQTTYAYDGYDRRIIVTDPMGNVTLRHYDANDNVVLEREEGERLDVPGSAGNVRLAETAYQYDAMDRRVRRDLAHFDTQTQSPIGDGYASTLDFFSPNSQRIATVDDGGHTNHFLYDTVNRLAVTIDPKGNTRTNSYDAEGHLIAVTATDKSDLGNPDQSVTTTYAYDALDRRIESVNALGHTERFGYDSRGNRVLYTDTRTNQTRYVYDGLSRLIRTERDLDGNGLTSDPADIVTTQTWDDSARLIAQTDDNTNTTAYVYDSLNRRIRIDYADCTTQQTRYDAHDNVLSTTDANGTSVTNTYNLRNRLAARTIAPGPGVSSATTFEQYAHDGLGRLVRAQDNDSLVTRGAGNASGYDSLSHVLRETQQVTAGGGVPRTVVAQYDAEGNQTRLTYPGGRAIARIFDELDRPTLVRDDPPTLDPAIATFQYVGPHRMERRDYPKADPSQTTRLNAHYDALRRPMALQHLRDPDGLPRLIEDRFLTWDAANNKISDQRPFPAPPESRQYAYDAVNRLVQSQASAGGPPLSTLYELDGAGNRLAVWGDDFSGFYQRDGTLCEPADFQMNQYTATPVHPQRLHDANGNMAAIPGLAQFVYDYRNRLVQQVDLLLGQTRTYRYDALGRRIEKNVSGTITRFYYDGRREIEEQSVANATLATYVWRNSPVDNDDAEIVFCSLLQMARGGQKYYYHADDLGSVRHVTDGAGNLVESYSFGDFGKPSFFDAFGSPMAATAIGNPILFAGLRYDPDVGWYFFEARHLDPLTGHATTRNPDGLWTENPYGNAYTIENVNPTSSLLFAEGETGTTGTTGGEKKLCGGDAEGCKDPCGDAKTKGLDNGDIGGVICCKGKITSCIWKSGGATGAKNATAQKIIDDCGKAHEDDHHDDIDCPKDAELSRPAFKAGKDADTEEASAYKKELECLDNKKGDCGKDDACKKEVEKERELVKKRQEKHAKAAAGKGK